MKVFLFIILAVAVYACWKSIRRKQLRAQIELRQVEIAKAVTAFENFLNGHVYFNHRKYTVWHQQFSYLANWVKQPLDGIGLDPSLYNQAHRLAKYLADPDPFIEHHNIRYVATELSESKSLFDTVEKNPLNHQQREAIVHDEDHNLVIAGAGTGKTSTIVGKVAHLVKRKEVPPERILVLAFARKAMEEMEQRIGECVGEGGFDVKVGTFHSFGLRIVAEVEGQQPTLLFEQEEQEHKFIHECYQNQMENEAYRNRMVEYLAYDSIPYRSESSFESFEEAKNYRYAADLRTMHGEVVKSHEELLLANCLALHGVEYEYEKPYEIKTADVEHSQYRPDFYLSDYGIYIEHFGIDQNGDVPRWFSGKGGKTATELYGEGIQWKRRLHEENETILIETYSHENQQGKLLDGLLEKLKEHEIEFKPLTSEEAMALMECNRPRAVPDFIVLTCTILTLFRSNQYTIPELESKARQSEESTRALAFIALFAPILDAYEVHLENEDAVDFSEMILRATQYLKNGQYNTPYSYVLIDEFQDMSVGRFKLIKALLEQDLDQRLYCVGDDWQSIYRFTGSDISIIVEFEKYFDYTKTTKLETTYRFNDQIADVSGKFIQQNPKQLKKTLKSETLSSDDAFIVSGKSSADSEMELLGILGELNAKANANDVTYSVFLLGRYKFNRPENFASVKQGMAHLDLTFHTVHGAKGLEADYVVIDHVIAAKSGFPSEIVDDPLLQLILATPEPHEHAEERRLFYVAMTRARHKFYVLTEAFRKSVFVKEIEATGTKTIKCPSCDNGQLYTKLGQEGPYWGCSNYNFCRYTIDDSHVQNEENFLWRENVGKGTICPSCHDAYMVIRQNREDGSEFYGCSNYGRTTCTCTRPVTRRGRTIR